MLALNTTTSAATVNLASPRTRPLIRGILTTAVAGSHIGKAPVRYSSDVLIELSDEPFSDTDSRFFNKRTLRVKGPKGEVKLPIEPFVKLRNQAPSGGNASPVSEGQLWVEVEDPKVKCQRAMWGTTRALISNSVIGVSEGFTTTLRLVGVGYRASMEGPDKRTLQLKLGFSHPVDIEVPPHLEVTTPVPTRIVVKGTDLQQINLFAAKIRQWKKPEPYNQKGIFVGSETIRKKEVKTH
ncbi:54S ribosomal protein L6 mitochondrial [Spiromyces aspiralis]|uniref:54S ribosomal protein L6 mitochondrial n=1 Tax=Spiromyces aspiralis TaxID=68401 RepID=A0ACC1HUL2_9FUNG|nr:54S ribosomal protein L6 mitochondrial [Spiromyces aspiralis]